MIIDRNIKPVSKNKPSFEIPKIEISKTGNNIDLYNCEKNSLPIVSLSLLIYAGSRLDPNEKKGLAYLTSSLIKEGAGKYNALEIKEVFQSLGISFTVSLNHEYVSFYLLSLTENFEKGFELLSQILTNPHFTETDFLLAKKNLQTNLIHAKIDPNTIASICYRKVLTPGLNSSHPTFGYPEHIERITNQDVKDFYKNNYVPSGAKLCITGDISTDKINHLVSRYLTNWNFPKPEDLPRSNCQNKPSNFYFTNLENAPQSIIYFGHKIKTRDKIDFHALSLANGILGGNFSSRLNKNLREDKGYTYGISSRFAFNKECGLFTIDTAVDSKKTIDTINEVISEIKNLYNSVTEEELEFNKSFLINHFPASFETYTNITSILVSLANYDLPISYLENYIDSILQIDVLRMNEFIKENLLIDYLQIYVCGDKNEFVSSLPKSFSNSLIELDTWGDILN